jgi:hypothetical protein
MNKRFRKYLMTTSSPMVLMRTEAWRIAVAKRKAADEERAAAEEQGLKYVPAKGRA